MQMKPRMALEPRLDSRVLVRGIIVHDQMKVPICGRLRIDLLEEPDELLMPVARHAIANDLAVEHAQSGKQRRCAVAFVVVSLPCWNTRSERQQWLRAFQCLYLALFVHAQNQRLVRRVQIQTHDIGQFLDKVFVAAEFESLYQMRFEIVHVPDATNAGLRQVLRLGHAARAPMRRIVRLRMQGGFDNGLDFGWRDALLAARTWRILFETGQPQGQKSFAPELYGRTRQT